MASPILSVNNLLANENTYGNIRQSFQLVTAVTSTVLSTNGAVMMEKVGTYTVPALSGASYYYLTSFKEWTNTQVLAFAALEVNMGSLTLGSSFVSGSAMPTRTIQGGSSTQLASSMPAIIVTSTLTAISPTITVTYTDQAGNTGHSVAIPLPTNAIVNSTFMLEPYLQSGDTGIRAVTNITTSAGSAGTVAVVGLLPLAYHAGNSIGANIYNGPLQNAMTMYPLQGSDNIGIYRGATSALAGLATINLVPGS